MIQMIFLPWGLAGDPIIYCFLFQVYNNTVTTYLWQFSKIIEQFKGNRVEVACELQTYFGSLLLSLRKTLLFFGEREATTGNMSAVHRLELRRLRETLGLG